MNKKLVAILAILLTGTAFAASSLKGSPGSMARQNEEADREDLSRMSNIGMLDSFKERHLLVPLPVGNGVVIDSRLPDKYRWCRPWVRDYLVDLGKDFKRDFGRSIQINSAVRTVDYQEELLWERGNGNAASTKPGPHQSSHLTGSTVDIAKMVMSRKELQWMRDRLLADEEKGLTAIVSGSVEATEEFHQAVFHVMVFQKNEKAAQQ